MPQAAHATLADRLLAGERGALARMISWAENGHAAFPAALEAFWSRVGKAPRLGITGPPGAGKSTLVDELARALRKEERTVGVLAVDPSSPLTGGALLGDRIRMEDHTTDPGVFIRSMASRGREKTVRPDLLQQNPSPAQHRRDYTRSDRTKQFLHPLANAGRNAENTIASARALRVLATPQPGQPVDSSVA